MMSHADTTPWVTGRIRDRARLHGNVGVLRTGGRGRVHRDHPPCAGARLQLPRHRGHVRPVHQRTPRRQGHLGTAGRGRHRHQVRQRAARGRILDWHQRPARVRPVRLRRIPGAARDRPHRPVLPASRRRNGADRGHRGRHGRARAGRQGSPPRSVGGRRGHDPARQRGAPDQRAADRVQPVYPRRRERDPADGA